MYKAILYFHILCGVVALLSGAGAIATKKGLRIHRKSGIIYYYCMYGIGLT